MTDSPPAHFRLVCNKIMLENPHIFLMKTGSKEIARIEKIYAMGFLRDCQKCRGVFVDVFSWVCYNVYEEKSEFRW